MIKKSYPCFISISLLISGCVTLPTEPNVIALPGTGKNLERFHLDDINCQKHASLQARDNMEKYTINNYAIQNQYDVNYIQCMYAYGHHVPVMGNYAPSQRKSISSTTTIVPPPPPPGSPPSPPPK
jgi:hypothetical protein